MLYFNKTVCPNISYAYRYCTSGLLRYKRYKVDLFTRPFCLVVKDCSQLAQHPRRLATSRCHIGNYHFSPLLSHTTENIKGYETVKLSKFTFKTQEIPYIL